jgi:hypothetical protein
MKNTLTPTSLNKHKQRHTITVNLGSTLNYYSKPKTQQSPKQVLKPTSSIKLIRTGPLSTSKQTRSPKAPATPLEPVNLSSLSHKIP